MGVVYLQNGVCLFFKMDDYIWWLKMVENEVVEIDGECVIFEMVVFD